MGIKLNISDTPFIIDTPQGTTGQVMDIYLGGGDFKNCIRQF